MISYPLIEIILIAFLAVLGNASTWVEMEEFGHAKEHWLKKLIKLKNGIPSHDTFRRYYLIRPFKRKIITEWKGLKAFVCYIKNYHHLGILRKMMRLS